MSDIVDLDNYRKKHYGDADPITREIAEEIERTLEATTLEVNERIKIIEATHFSLNEGDETSPSALIEKFASIRIDYSSLVLDLFKKIVILERELCFYKKGYFPPEK